MSLTIIIKESARDRQERVYNSVQRNPQYRGKVSASARTADEANDIMQKELKDRENVEPILVEGGPERLIAFESEMKQHGWDPDAIRHQWGLDKNGNKVVAE